MSFDFDGSLPFSLLLQMPFANCQMDAHLGHEVIHFFRNGFIAIEHSTLIPSRPLYIL